MHWHDQIRTKFDLNNELDTNIDTVVELYWINLELSVTAQIEHVSTYEFYNINTIIFLFVKQTIVFVNFSDLCLTRL